MNTVKSVYYGWGAFIAAGAGAYYFAKKSINADRAARAEADRQKRIAHQQLENEYRNKFPPANAQQPIQSSIPSTPAASQISNAYLGSRSELNKERVGEEWGNQRDEAGNPSQEASQDPAPTRHAPEDEGQKMREKSKYEATDVFRSRKGDRFS
ncbi:uncharacterized protein EI97DRAFT_501227 [Westerdykella ornata]|uniref:Uncharacterized protein n=1 Tax=Westerdykella ornata TaxID=318751 RepID=A0A6A6JLD4_WESOR|nr:uncharacterized protein EI97DRAFT_501227 [Westerdykella ornata]KAF2276466.1 hypothetical protein EI97DRAFT_501227 [Westerdykella ornata]